MRRGLLVRSEAEAPAAEFDARLGELRRHAQESGFTALLLYTNFSRPATVGHFTHFVPYWSHGMLVVPASGPSVLVACLSKRVEGWMREAGRLERIACVPDLGNGVAAVLADAGCADGLIGAALLADLPHTVVSAVQTSLPHARLIDASELVRRLMMRRDAIAVALRQKAIDIGQRALAHASSAAGSANAMAAAIELSARAQGAEEVLITFAPDLQADPRMRRLEGSTGLGERYAVQLSLAYKGQWVRLGRSVATRLAPPYWREANEALQCIAAAFRTGEDAAWTMRRSLAERFGTSEVWWVVETCGLGSPFATLACSEGRAAEAPRVAGQPVVVTLRLQHRDGVWSGTATGTVEQGTSSRHATQEQRSES